MAPVHWLSAGVLALNTVIGVALVLGVFMFMERRIHLGAFGGLFVGAAVIYVEATMGERLLQVTVGEMKLLVLAAAFGAVLGVVGTVLTVKPEL
ncbi:hypothetical protein [Haloplanus halophilus]|uniref:hypothetical protein n=1 Tax=Haloplanus halophilus TaxID=2949993 RepID=UPI00203C0299|nr:hypothetical protein [Haloplanus sp. GDY1]